MIKNGGNSKAVSSEKKIGTADNALTKQKPKPQGKKRKRNSSASSSEAEDVLPENTLEIENKVHASAVKNNLDDASVRKILKKVVTNDHVLALVKLREEEDSGTEETKHRPKLTRAKARELKKVSPKTAPWNLENLELTPIKHIPVKTRPEVKALIAQELPEDEDDDEYKPGHDEVPSDDDQTLESSSDLDSQPRTPATPHDKTTSPKVIQDGPFKVPQEVNAARRKLNLEEEATIARRTRSKLSLSSTPIEHIESTFVPPDDLPMPAVDDLWNQFLSECLNPASSSRHEDDDDADPEYNVAADPDAHDEDEESLGNSLIKISKKELNDLVTELFNIMPADMEVDGVSDNLAGNVPSDHVKGDGNTSTRWEGKQEPTSDDEDRPNLSDKITFENSSYTRVSVGKGEKQNTEPEEVRKKDNGQKGKDKEKASNDEDKDANTVTEKNGDSPSPLSISMVIEEREESASVPRWMRRHMPPRAAEEVVHIQIPTDSVSILPEQILILQQQLRQHIQLATSNYLQLYVHPVHWKMAHAYKEYLDSLNKMAEKTVNSVVDVCNLKPAWELILSWEKTVSENTPENTAMVKFVLKEADRCRRRMNANNLYVGEFHETFKKVVANSPVFLYPYLLPAMPYRGESSRRAAYTRSEDEYIALGLDQFWNHVEANPEIFVPNGHSKNPRTRWGLYVSVQLVVKHMMPWTSGKLILGHINNIRKYGDKTNPINKFLANRDVKAVEHKLLPYNPKITLYEQPEHEMPRLWVRYLSKTSKRFRLYLNSRKIVTGFAPDGVPIIIGQDARDPTKKPLPIDFTKKIPSNRQNVRFQSPEQDLSDRVDIEISRPETNIQAPIIIRPLNTSQTSNFTIHTPHLQILPTIPSQLPSLPVITPQMPTVTSPQINNPHEASLPVTPQLPNLPVTPQLPNLPGTPGNSQTEASQNIPASKPLIMYNVVKTNTGAILVPVTRVMMVNSNVAPITTPAEVTSKTNSLPENSTSQNVPSNETHCRCCRLLRKITKRQTTILEYFKGSKKSAKTCFCSDVKYPKVSKRLRLFINGYQNRFETNLHLVQRKLNGGNDNDETGSYDTSDLEFVSSFQNLLLTRINMSRMTHIKKRVHTLFSKFDKDEGDPISLAKKLDVSFNDDLADMYREFLAFLTPDQADRMDMFRDYFRRTCVGDLTKKIEDMVTDEVARKNMLKKLHHVFFNNFSSACGICYDLLGVMRGHPQLAEYTFSLFPHRRKTIDPAPTQKRYRHKNNYIMPHDPHNPIPIGPKTPTAQINYSQKINSKGGVIVIDNAVSKDGQSDQMEKVVAKEESNVSEEAVTSVESQSAIENTTAVEPCESQIEDDRMDDEETIIKIEHPLPETIISSTQFLVTKTPFNLEDTNELSNSSMCIVFDDGSVKPEVCEWSRYEDKLILEVLKEQVTPKERKDKTIIEILEEKNVLQMISDSLTHKTLEEVRSRVLYLLKLLVLSEK